MHRHAELLSEELGELHGCTDFRKHVAWYLKGFSVGSEVRRALAWSAASTSSPGCWPGSPTSPTRSPSSAPRAAAPAPRGRWRCRRAGSPTATTPVRRPAPSSRSAADEAAVTTGPFLYDDGPEPLHTGHAPAPAGLLIAIFGGTAILAVLMVLALPLIKGSPGDQAKDAVGVFLGGPAEG